MVETSGVKAPGKKTSRRWWYVGGLAAVVAGIVTTIALPAPRQPVHIHNEVTISRTAPEVFDYVTTPDNWPKWHPSSLAVSGATDHSLRVGEQATEEYLVTGRRGLAQWTVTERNAPLRWAIEGYGQGGGQAWVTYTLTENAGITRFERDMRYRMPNLFAALLDPMLTREKIVMESTAAVNQLKQVLERGRKDS